MLEGNTIFNTEKLTAVIAPLSLMAGISHVRTGKILSPIMHSVSGWRGGGEGVWAAVLRAARGVKEIACTELDGEKAKKIKSWCGGWDVHVLRAQINIFGPTWQFDFRCWQALSPACVLHKTNALGL